MAKVYVSVGSNIEPAENIRAAIDALRDCYSELLISTVYESEAVGFAGDNFYNLVVAFETDDKVHGVASTLHHLEDEQARDRKGPRFSARTIDLDLLLYDDLILNENGLNVPRDEITQNAFVLQPLAELAGETLHPQLKTSLAKLWQAFDKESQQLWPIPFDWG